MSVGLARRRLATVQGLSCLAAAVAYAWQVDTYAAPRVDYVAQPGVRIEQAPQRGLVLPRQQVKPSAAPSAAQPAKPPQPLRPSAPHGPVPELQLRLSTTLGTWVQNAAFQHGAPAASASAAPASAPLPSWWEDLMTALYADEQGKPQPQLPEQIAAHAQTLRARADAALAARLGWVLYRAEHYAAAAQWFEIALARDSTAASARQGLFYALERAGRWKEAFAAAEDDEKLHAARADLAVQLALRARDAHDPAQAAHWLEQAIALGKDGEDIRSLLAWTLLQADQPAQAAAQFEALLAAYPHDADLAQGLYLSLQRSGQTGKIDALAARPGAFAAEVRKRRALHWRDLGLARDAAALDPAADAPFANAASPSIAFGVHTRDKSGAAGTSQLHSTEPALRLRWASSLGAWEANIASTRLDAGATPPIGQVGSTLPGAQGSPGVQNVGLSGELRWRQLGPRGLFASLGTTPNDGAVGATWTGSLGWRDIGSDHDWQIAMIREPVDDSVLSRTGLRDPASGLAWGRVLREGFSLGGYQTLWPQWNGSAQLRLDRLAGHNVASNNRLAVSLGLAHDLPLNGMRLFSVGPMLAYERYARNLSGFTWGQGGYFSPQKFFSASLLAMFQTADAKPWVLAGQFQLGWQSVRQDGSACFALPPPLSGSACAPLAPNASSGIGTSARLQGVALFAPQWALEANALLRTGPAYHDRMLYFGVRYFFSPRRALYGDDLPGRP